MKNSAKSAFITMVALLCYSGFATAQTVSFDSPGDLSALMNDLKGGPGGHGGGQFNHVPKPPPPTSHNGGPGNHNNPGNHNGPGNNGGFGNHNNPGNHNGPGNHNNPDNNGWNPNGPGGHNNPGNHNGPGPQPGPWHPQPGPGNHNDHNGPGPQPGPWHPQPGPQPGPWHPQPGPQPGPWHPQPGPNPWHPQPGQWQPHHNGQPNWDNNNWGNNHWNNHGPEHSGWWSNYNGWWAGTVHPYSMYRTVCTVTPGVSAKGFIVEQARPFYGRATFYYYNIFNSIVGTSNPANSVYSGGNGTPVFDFYRVPSQADHCFLAITQ